MSKRPIVLMTLDGCGPNSNCDYNVVCEGKTSVMDQLMSQYPSVKDEASGMTVGLPEGQIRNSEIGHLNMGTGRIVYQELTRITRSTQDGNFFQVPEFLVVMGNCKRNNSTLHMFGLVFDDEVHNHNMYIYGLLGLARRDDLEKVYVHCSLDGHGTPPGPGKGYVAVLEAKMKEIGVEGAASVMGRYYTIDRDERWGRVELAYNALTKGRGNTTSSTTEGIQTSYDTGRTDEFAVLFVVEKDGKPTAMIGDGDSVIFHNFRLDRAKEIIRAFCDNGFDSFARNKKLDFVLVCFIGYDETIENKLIAFKEEGITNTFGEFLVAHGKTQVRITETEKYAHITFFFNGSVEELNSGKDCILVPFLKEVAAYDLKPEMSALGVRDRLVEAIKFSKYDVIIISFIDPDMVGHIGVKETAIKTVETVDVCVGRAVEVIKEMDGVMFICADHGNAEQLVDYEADEPFTARTTSPVPFILINADSSYKLHEGEALCDIIPTLIQLTGMEQSEEIAGTSLLVR